VTETALIPAAESPAAIMERVVIVGDLSKLTDQERVTYYFRVCESIGLNPLTKPFDYITLNGKLTLYPNKDCAAQLRKLQIVTITDLRTNLIGDVYIVTVAGRLPNGREDMSTGAVNVKALSGESLANAYMKAETKAKRRLSLSLAGLGFADEAEVEGLGEEPPAPKVTLAERVAAKAAEITAPAAADGAAEGTPGPVTVDPATPAEALAKTPEQAAEAVAVRRAARVATVPAEPEGLFPAPADDGLVAAAMALAAEQRVWKEGDVHTPGHKGLIRNARGLFCATKLTDGKWCQFTERSA